MNRAVPESSRPLTEGERALAASIFGDAIDYAAVRIHRRKWWPFQMPRLTMAPDGDIWFHPRCDFYSEDFSTAPLPAQAHLLHEMTHVAQAQQRGRWYLVLMRHPFCRYRYRLAPSRPFERYGLEQQGEIVRHIFLLRNGRPVPGAAPLDQLEALFGAWLHALKGR